MLFCNLALASSKEQGCVDWIELRPGDACSERQVPLTRVTVSIVHPDVVCAVRYSFTDYTASIFKVIILFTLFVLRIGLEKLSWIIWQSYAYK